MSRSYGYSAESGSFASGRTGGQTGVLSVIGQALGLAIEVPLNWLQRDRDRRRLQALDDRLLRDIGIGRSEVEEEAGKPFWRA